MSELEYFLELKQTIISEQKQRIKQIKKHYGKFLRPLTNHIRRLKRG